MTATIWVDVCGQINGPKDFVVVSDTDPSKTYHVTGLYSESQHPRCSCPAFEFSKARPRTCKHVKRLVEEPACGWHSEHNARKPQETPGECPMCGGPTVKIEYAI